MVEIALAGAIGLPDKKRVQERGHERREDLACLWSGEFLVEA